MKRDGLDNSWADLPVHEGLIRSFYPVNNVQCPVIKEHCMATLHASVTAARNEGDAWLWVALMRYSRDSTMNLLDWINSRKQRRGTWRGEGGHNFPKCLHEYVPVNNLWLWEQVLIVHARRLYLFSTPSPFVLPSSENSLFYLSMPFIIRSFIWEVVSDLEALHIMFFHVC